MLHLVGFYITLNTLMMHGQTQIKFDGVFKTKKNEYYMSAKSVKVDIFISVEWYFFSNDS